MGLKFIKKRFPKPSNRPFIVKVEEPLKEKPKKEKNNIKKNKDDMLTVEQINAVENMANGINSVKVVKKDRGLIERTESSKIVLTEDNRQVLVD